MKENVFIKNLKELYQANFNIVMIKRCARNDVRWGDISEEEHKKFIEWLEEQEQEEQELTE